MQFNKYAMYYDYLYKDKDYESECNFLSSVIDEHFRDGKKKGLIDLGCGTGNHLKFFNLNHNACGYDGSITMVNMATAKKLNVYHRDMREVKAPADIYICMFHAMNYLQDFNDWIKTIGNIYKSLNKNGLFILECKDKETLSKDYRRSVDWVKYNSQLNRVDMEANFDGEFLDVTIKIGSEIKENHKMLILSCKSIMDMLESGGFNKTNITKIKSKTFPKSVVFICKK